LFSLRHVGRRVVRSPSPPVALNFNSKKDDDDDLARSGMMSRRRRPPRDSGLFALDSAASQSINLAAHLSISSRQKKVSLHHASCFLRVADAAPTNGVFFELFLALDSLCYLFRKKFIVCNFPVPISSSPRLRIAVAFFCC